MRRPIHGDKLAHLNKFFFSFIESIWQPEIVAEFLPEWRSCEKFYEIGMMALTARYQFKYVVGALSDCFNCLFTKLVCQNRIFVYSNKQAPFFVMQHLNQVVHVKCWRFI